MQYRKSATKTPSATWFPRSRMKLRRSRGPNWTEARVIATIMIEKTTPATVIIDAATVDSSVRAPSAPPGGPNAPLASSTSIASVTKESAPAASASRIGTDQ